jgi:hypothetical protein
MKINILVCKNEHVHSHGDTKMQQFVLMEMYVKKGDIYKKIGCPLINNILHNINQINTTLNDIDIKVVKHNIE